MTLVACNTPDRPNGFIQPPKRVERTKTKSDTSTGVSNGTKDHENELVTWTKSLETFAEHAVTLMQA
jgi:hypothetical protein